MTNICVNCGKESHQEKAAFYCNSCELKTVLKILKRIEKRAADQLDKAELGQAVSLLTQVVSE